MDTLRATTAASASGTSRASADVSDHEASCDVSDDDGDDSDIYDPSAQIWKDLTAWAQTVELSINTDIIHPSLLKYQESEDMQLTQRQRTSTLNESVHPSVNFSFSSDSGNLSDASPAVALERNMINVAESRETDSTKKCSPTISHFFAKLRKTVSFILFFFTRKRKKLKPEKEGWHTDDDDDDDDLESDELGVTSNIVFIFSQCVGWIICCVFAGKYSNR